MRFSTTIRTPGAPTATTSMAWSPARTSTFHCLPAVAGTPKSKIQTDGDNGIDNSWGSNLMPIIENLSSSPSQQMTDSIQSGQFTMLFNFQNLDPAPSQNAVSARVYAGAPTAPPQWNGSDVWPVTAESVNGSINQPKVSFPTSYVVGGTWVSGTAPSPTELPIPIDMGGTPLLLRIRVARVTMSISGTGSTAQGASGIISGVLNTQELVDELKKVAGSFDPGLCDGPTFDSIAQQIKAASDILSDGTQDPTKPCDGISIGLGFTAKAVQLGSVATPVPPAPDPCN